MVNDLTVFSPHSQACAGQQLMRERLHRNDTWFTYRQPLVAGNRSPRKYLDVSSSGRCAHCPFFGWRCMSNRTSIPSLVNRTAACKARYSTKMTMVSPTAWALCVKIYISAAARSVGVTVPSRLTPFNFLSSDCKSTSSKRYKSSASSVSRRQLPQSHLSSRSDLL